MGKEMKNRQRQKCKWKTFVTHSCVQKNIYSWLLRWQQQDVHNLVWTRTRGSNNNSSKHTADKIKQEIEMLMGNKCATKWKYLVEGNDYLEQKF